MAVLRKLIIRDFRNISLAELSFSPSINCICGANGQGKTNLLDAIYMLSMTKSAFVPSDSFCIRHGCTGFSLAGNYMMPDGIESLFSLCCGVRGKTLKRDGKAYASAGAHIGILPVVLVSPKDSSLISDSGEPRRRFANAVLSQINPLYLENLQRYNRILAQRNRLLKDGSDESLLSVLDESLATYAPLVHSERSRFTASLAVAASAYYSRLGGDGASVGVSYRSDLGTAEGGAESAAGVLLSLLARARRKDAVLGYTSVGLQRDDFEFTIDGHPIRHFGSQGQQKSFLTAIKLAQSDIMKSEYGFPPALLLDDVFDKLDPDRTGRLVQIVSGEGFGQIFITDTDRNRMERIISDIAPDTLYFSTEDGKFQTDGPCACAGSTIE